MAIIIICGIVALIISIIDYNDAFDTFFNVIIGLGVGLVLFILIGGAIGSVLPQEEVVEEQRIYALNDSSAVEGEKFLFSGHIDEQLVYRYVTNNDKGKRIEELDNGEVYIKEGNYTPALEHHYNILSKNWHKLFANAWFSDEYYIFCVPRGTVTNEYNIDLN